jgi:hypothetical protein
MKIASRVYQALRLSSSALALLVAFGAGGAFSAHAANAAPDTSVPMLGNPAEAAVASATPASPAIPAPPAAPAIANTVVPAPPVLASASIGGRDKNLLAMEDKVTDSVKNVIKQFGTVDNVNLDDMNMARQAVAKLDVLIDIEKHLAELDRIHAERSGEKSLASVIPASALSAPGHKMQSSTSAEADLPVMAAPVVGRGEVALIAGTDGHYSAIVQGKTVHVGDTLPDGSSVIAITAKQVEVKQKGGTVRWLKVHGVDEVYGHSL